jgi:hypothetical protein
MIKVNIKTLTATREPIPLALIGLSAETLRNLQTELNPVPAEFKDIEFWGETDATPAFDNATHTFDGTEILTVDIETKTVIVTKGIRAKTEDELIAERKALVPQTITRVAAMKAMKATGALWSDFNAILDLNQDAKDEWSLATELQRNNEFVGMLSPALGLNDIQIDELFILGGKLQ